MLCEFRLGARRIKFETYPRNPASSAFPSLTLRSRSPHDFPILYCRRQLRLHPLDNARILAARVLPEQADPRVPGAVVAVQEPAIIGRARQHDPGRAPE